MPPRYTVLLPTHNRAEAVGRAIASVLRQTDRDFELLVVGDGCTDDTASVVATFRDARLRWFDLPKAPNFGYANRNIALREAQGDLVAFMAHDDLFLPDHLEFMATPFTDDEVEWAYSRPLWVADDGRTVPFAIDLRVAAQREVFLTHHNSIPASCVVYRRRLHERVGLWPEEIASSGDWEMWKRMIGPSNGANVAYVAEPTTLHFRADWRPSDAWGPPPLHDWLEVAATDAWPASLRFRVPMGATAQAAAATVLSDACTQRVRAAIPAAMDVLAWASAAARADQAHGAETRIAAAEARVTDADARRADADDRAATATELATDADSRATEAEAQAADAEARVATAVALAADAERRATAAEGRAAAAEARAATAEARAAAAESQAGSERSRAAEAEARAHAAQVRAARITATAALSRTLRRLRVVLRGNPLFDASWYSRHYGDVAPSDAARHWRRHGLRMDRRPNAEFDAAAYLERYPDVRASGMDPLDHFYIFGASESRSVETTSKSAG